MRRAARSADEPDRCGAGPARVCGRRDPRAQGRATRLVAAYPISERPRAVVTEASGRSRGFRQSAPNLWIRMVHSLSDSKGVLILGSGPCRAAGVGGGVLEA